LPIGIRRHETERPTEETIGNRQSAINQSV
jgi:hypothetical protein